MKRKNSKYQSTEVFNPQLIHTKREREKKAIKMLAMSSLMMPVPMLGASQLVHKPPEAKLLAIHSHNQPQATPQHHLQQPNHMQQQPQQQQSKPGR